MIIFFWINAQNIYLNYIVYVFIIIILFWGVEVAPAYHEVIKKLKMNHLWLYMLHDISHSMPQRLQNVIKNKWGMPVTEVLNTCTRKSNKHLLKISCKNKVLIKSFSLWNWIGTNFWDTLYLYDVPGKVFNAVCDLIQFPSRLRSRKTRYIATDHDDAIITCGVLGSWENPLVKKESKTVLVSGLRAVESGFQILCQWILGSNR